MKNIRFTVYLEAIFQKIPRCYTPKFFEEVREVVPFEMVYAISVAKTHEIYHEPVMFSFE